MLIVVGGLPATGKTTICIALAAELRVPHVRIGTIEAAIGRAEGAFADSNEWRSPPGYDVGCAIAADQLRLGLDVVAESVNPVGPSRDAWRATRAQSGAGVLEVEVVCSDADEHRRRAEGRTVEIPGLTKPTWEQIRLRHSERWDRERLVVDTAALAVEESASSPRRWPPRGDARSAHVDGSE